jgi:peptidoglycan hydrolase-like protein with peptidoglycan-binding domain
MKRSTRWMITLGAAGGLAAGAFGVVGLAGASTPEQAAADAAPPPAGFVTAEVEFGTLEETFRLRADPVTAGADATIASPRDGVVTGDCPADVALDVGGVACEVNGEPVVLADFAFAPYRDLTGGISGPDVAELQRLLSDMGHPVPDDGKFGPGTQAAAARAFAELGYTLPEVLPDYDEAVRAADAAVDAAQANLDEARQPELAGDAATTGPSDPDDGTMTPPDPANGTMTPPDPDDVAAAERALRDAHRTLADTRLAGGSYVPAGWLLAAPSGSRTVGHPEGTAVVASETPLLTRERQSALRFTVPLPSDAKDRIDDLTFTADVEGTPVELTPTGVAPTGTDDGEADGAGARIELAGPPDAGLGSDRSLVVDVTTDSERLPGLIVPDVGIYVREADTLAVAVPVSDGTETFEYVPVRVVHSAAGRSIIAPTDGTLEAGDLVILSIGQAPAIERDGGQR